MQRKFAEKKNRARVAIGKKSSKCFLLSSSLDWLWKLILAQAITHEKTYAQPKRRKQLSCPRKLPTTPFPLKKLMVHPKVNLFWDPCGRRGIKLLPSLPICVSEWSTRKKYQLVHTGVDCCALIGYRRFQTVGLKNSGSCTELNNEGVLLCLCFRVRTCLWWHRIPSSRQKRSLKWLTMYITKWVIAKTKTVFI